MIDDFVLSIFMARNPLNLSSCNWTKISESEDCPTTISENLEFHTSYSLLLVILLSHLCMSTAWINRNCILDILTSAWASSCWCPCCVCCMAPTPSPLTSSYSSSSWAWWWWLATGPGMSMSTLCLRILQCLRTRWVESNPFHSCLTSHFSDWQNWFDPDIFVLFPACADHDALQTHWARGWLRYNTLPGWGEESAQGHE